MKKRFDVWRLAGLLCVLLLCAGCRKEQAVYDSGLEQAELTAEAAGETEGAGKADGDASGGEAVQPQETVLLCVYVCGQVEQPGLYELPEGSRIGDAVDAAGGMKPEAAATYLNLAELLADGQKIEVPSIEEAEELETVAAEEESGLVNLNTATAEELMTLTGIGEAKARDILAYREEHGGFDSIEQLKEISGIKDGVFKKIEDQITV